MKHKHTRKVVDKDGIEKVEAPKGLHEGTLRVVTEADILSDPRLVAASIVVGQLFDFSNLPFVKDGAVEAYVEKVNEKKVEVEEANLNPLVPEFTSEVERAELNAKFPDNTNVEKVEVIE